MSRCAWENQDEHWVNALQTTSGPWQKQEGPNSLASAYSAKLGEWAKAPKSWIHAKLGGMSLIKDIWWDLSNKSELGSLAKTAVSLSCAFPFSTSCSVCLLVHKGRQAIPGKVGMMSR